MKTFKTIITLIILSLSVISCSKDDNNDTKPVYLLETITSSVNGLQTKFTYNDQNLLTHIDYYSNNTVSDGLDLTYIDGKVDKVTYSDSFTKISYDSNGKIIKVLSYDVNGATQTMKLISDYIYSGQTITVIEKTPANVLKYKSEYVFDSNQNLSEVKRCTVNAANPNGLYSGSFYLSNYDDKQSAYKSLPAAISFPLLSRNNYRTTLSSDNTTSTFTYVYNDAGYPITSSTSASSEVTNFQYLIK